MITITKLLDMHELRAETWECDDFWEIVEAQNLWDRLDNYLFDYYSVDATDPSIGTVNDLLRFEGETVLKDIGADLEGTIFDDDSSDEDDEEDEELIKALGKCRDYNY